MRTTISIVSNADFLTQMAPLAALRATQGHQAKVVSVDDVYDEFGFGQRSPRALKDFLSHARATWSVPPRYVVLAGDATFDPRDYAGLGVGDFVPTRLVDMSEIELETASDDWFTDINEDGLPDFAIGRLPVRTTAQASTVVAKLTGYDAEPAGAWSTSLALVTDTDDPTVHFRSSSADLETRLPSSYVPHRLDRDVLGVATLRSDLFGLVNQGQLIVNYLGHGSTYIWGKTGELLTTADIGSNWTTSGSRLPFVVAMNCLNGFFQGIYGEESLAETLLRNGGGAVAVWASSSLTDAEPQGVMNDELYKLVFNALAGDARRCDDGGQGRGGESRRAPVVGVLRRSGDAPQGRARLDRSATGCADAVGDAIQPELRRGHRGRSLDVGDAQPVGADHPDRRWHGDLDGLGRSTLDSGDERLGHGERALHD